MEVSGQLHALAALPQGKSPWYPLDRRMDGPQSQSKHSVEERISQPHWDSNPDHLIAQPIASVYTDWSTPALFKTRVAPKENSSKCYLNAKRYGPRDRKNAISHMKK
jgi:hypothetical protein